MGFFDKLKKSFEFETTSPNQQKNPILPILQKHSGRSDLEKISAKLGFALKIVHADGRVAEEEKELLTELLHEYLGISNADAQAPLEEMLQIEDINLEMMYFAQALNKNTDEAERKEFLADLFRVAHADDEYAMLEEQDIRMISKYLHLDHQALIEERRRAKDK